MEPSAPLTDVFLRMKKVQREGLERLGLHSALDLLYHLPAKYLTATPFSDSLTKGDLITVRGTIESIQRVVGFGKKRIPRTEALLHLGDSKLKVLWYHQPYLAKTYPAGVEVTLTGRVAGDTKPYLANPKISKNIDTLSASVKEAILCPVYPSTDGVSSLFLSGLVKKLLTEKITKPVSDPIPESILKRYNLPSLHDSFLYCHLPRNHHEHKAARKRFIFEKTFLLQMRNQLSRLEREAATAPALPVDMKDISSFMKSALPFTPTKGQKKSVQDVVRDIAKPTPMARLLEGDVGSGKTAVAATVLYGVAVQATKHPPQTAYLAPTEVLARQQFDTLVSLFKDLPVQIGYLSSSGCMKYPSKVTPTEAAAVSKTQLKKAIASGEIALVVGTHAVIQKDISFKRLSLVIIDEQHRFGVAQRKRLLQQTDCTPHLLSMTATPIPRTLALTVYGDLSLSTLTEQPKGRKPVRTVLLTPSEIPTLYRHIRDEVEKGHQAYILCPAIDSDSALRSVEEEYTHLTKTVFPDYAVSMLHGKMKPKEKQEAMEKFSSGETPILVCTTVIEVGVDVPSATVIGILHAERFGLAQLHQLRGRVLRSSFQAHCYAVTGSKNTDTLARLQLFADIHDGFTLAQKDLELRGSGELDGLRQSGVPDLVMEGLQNPTLLSLAQKEAEAIVADDPLLEKHKTLRAALTQFLTQRE